MVIDLRRTVALRCPNCGKLELSELSLFHVSKRFVLECSCGFTKMVVSRRGRHYRLKVSCIICESDHYLTFTARRFIGSDYICIYCPDSEVELGHFGKDELVREAVREDASPLERVVLEAEADYFVRPDIMETVLTVLQAMIESGRLTCECGNDEISVNVYSNKIELVCVSCESFLLIYAENEKDLEMVLQAGQLRLQQGGFAVLDQARLFTNE